MVACPECGHAGSLGEFAYVAPAYEVGPTSLRRCPTCGGLFVVDHLEAEEKEPSSPPWGLSDVWGRKFTGKKREV
ncbi:MAG: zf-TFIIB domain-containing protein [Actinobacteria bacterium]|nr:zf-TFIIB domain-containing protein [Actinomycetota bacterium]